MAALPHLLRPVEDQPFQWTLNTDGRRHPVENTLAVSTLLCGIVGFITGIISSAHVIASWVGLIGMLVGFWSQYVSITTPQRSLNIIGIVGSFVGLALGIAAGGFMP
ncbi:hypothetical protein [Rhizohabitans arisaemae]|uniref:hypothetical protein n=1 Tax=Rhizohabitans arisaemae TaxID=2720610 RepID=UPI0024B1C4BB|nr:hypothetical protein [Rhizohabitans arisaemae]